MKLGGPVQGGDVTESREEAAEHCRQQEQQVWML